MGVGWIGFNGRIYNVSGILVVSFGLEFFPFLLNRGFVEIEVTLRDLLER